MKRGKELDIRIGHTKYENMRRVFPKAKWRSPSNLFIELWSILDGYPVANYEAKPKISLALWQSKWLDNHI